MLLENIIILNLYFHKRLLKPTLPFKILQMKKFIVILLFITCKSPKNEWISLIKNNSLDGWHYFQDDGLKKGWSVDDGILIFDKISGLESGEDDASLL